jgi:hypothetical protein
VLPDDPITAADTVLDLGMRERLVRMGLEEAAEVEPCCGSWMYLQVLPQ